MVYSYYICGMNTERDTAVISNLSKRWNIQERQIIELLSFLTPEECDIYLALRTDCHESSVVGDLETAKEEFPNIFIKRGDEVILTIDNLEYRGVYTGGMLIYDGKYELEKRLAGFIFKKFDYKAYVHIRWYNTPNMKYGKPYGHQPLRYLRLV